MKEFIVFKENNITQKKVEDRYVMYKNGEVMLIPFCTTVKDTMSICWENTYDSLYKEEDFNTSEVFVFKADKCVTYLFLYGDSLLSAKWLIICGATKVRIFLSSNTMEIDYLGRRKKNKKIENDFIIVKRKTGIVLKKAST